jgi:hypothetical protein
MTLTKEQRAVWRRALSPLARELLPAVEAIAEGLAAEIHVRVPDIGGNPLLSRETQASAKENVELALGLIRDIGDPSGIEPPPAAHSQARQFVLAGGQLTSLLRTYRIGHERFWTLWSDQLRTRVGDADEFACAVELSSTFMFEYVDQVASRLVDVFTTERERWVRGAAADRRETVQALLAGETSDTAAAGARLQYPLDRAHLAFVVWAEPTERDVLGVLEERAARLAAALGAGAPLLVSLDRLLIAGWVPRPRALTSAPVADLAASAGIAVRAAVGTVQSGPDGFRTSHAQALQAKRVTELTAGEPGTATLFRDVALTAAATSDVEVARWFVAQELAGLISAGDRLAETVLVYLEEASRPARTAKRLGVHENTVAYRVRKAESLLGRPLDLRPVELAVALRLHLALAAS